MKKIDVNNRPSLTEADMLRIERQHYPIQQDCIRPEGYELDVAMERMRELQSNSQWVSDQVKKLHREFERLRLRS